MDITEAQTMKKIILLLSLLSASAFAQVGPIAITATTDPCAQIAVGPKASQVAITVKGTWSGTLQPEVSVQGQAAANVQVVPSTSSTAQSTITANGTYFTVNVAGADAFYVCATSFASGTATVYLNLSNAGSTAKGGSSGGSGTVTSVTFTGDGVVDSATPSTAVTTSGTVTATPLTQTANTVLAGPTSGGALAPTFRALVALDIPTLIPIANIGSAGLSGTSPATISAAGAIGCATCVVASSPGVGIAHFAGSTQTATSSAVALGTADVSGQLPIGNVGSAGLSATNPMRISSAGVIDILGTGAIPVAAVPTAIPIGSVGSAGLSGTSPVTISAAGAIGCATCVAGASISYAAPTLTVSSAGNGNGAVALSGTTSGTASLTAPAVAGTATNPILITNSLQLPTGTVYNFNADTGISRVNAGIFAFGNGTNGSTVSVLRGGSFISVGTKFTTNAGCGESAGANVGGSAAGKITTVGSTSCTTIITLGGAATAINGWDCHAMDLTTLADVTNPHQTASTTTTATIVTGTIVSGDVIQFSCIGY